MANEAELAALRKCERDDCDYKVPKGVKDFKDILMAMANHLAAIHPASGGSEGGGGGGGKSNAPIPQLEENISEVSWTSWKKTDLKGGSCLARFLKRLLRIGFVLALLVTKIRKFC